jgi:arsenate reductase
MSKIKFYQYAKCSTCVKAKKFLDSKGVDYKDIPIVDSPPTKADLKKMLKAYDGELKKLFNTSGVMYREMNMKDKMSSLTEEKAFDLLSKNGKLVKRPFVISDQASRVGFKEDEWKEIFK